MPTCVLIALTLPPSVGLAQAGPDAARFVIGAGARRYRTNLTWSIGASMQLKASELRYRGVVTNEWLVAAVGQLGNRSSTHWLVAARVRGGRVTSGDVQDSDFDLAGVRVASRLTADVTGDDSWSASVAIGRRWLKAIAGRLAWLSVWLGLEHQRQSIRMQRGTWVIGPPGVTSVDGLDSRYHAQWRALWVAVEPALRIGHAHVLLRLGAQLRCWYSGEGSWNLRTELAQPVSFAHKASGWGYEARLSYSHWFGRAVGVTFSSGYTRRIARQGSDTMFRADGTTIPSTLREASSSSLGLGLEVATSF